MVPLLSELWFLACSLLTPEDQTEGVRVSRPPATALLGVAKTLLWAGLAVLAGLGLGQLR